MYFRYHLFEKKTLNHIEFKEAVEKITKLKISGKDILIRTFIRYHVTKYLSCSFNVNRKYWIDVKYPSSFIQTESQNISLLCLTPTTMETSTLWRSWILGRNMLNIDQSVFQQRIFGPRPWLHPLYCLQ